MINNTRPYIFWIGILLLLMPGLIHAYLLMPFPGSQDINAITLCYYLEKIILPLRILGAALMLWYFVAYFRRNTLTARIVKLVVMLICLGSYYYTDYTYKAEIMFKETQKVNFANAIKSRVPHSYLVIGVVHNGVAKAYPIIYLGYHHKMQDNIGNKAIMVTYCTMCRTGRVYDPVINGVKQSFRLVGARHYNAIIEDVGTKTWWYQSTGYAAVGPMKGAHLAEIPYEQLTLGGWLEKYPGSLILQPDNLFTNDYLDLNNYDRLQAIDRDSIENKDTLYKKSWMIGVIISGQPKAYDWRAMVKKRVLNDKINNTNLIVGMQKDSMNYHVYNATLNGRQMHFSLTPADMLTDAETSSIWDWSGNCVAGSQKGQKLGKIQAYQEYWRSWKQFHPNTLFWKD
ncbi:DUF3179 domain-containing (seleno)protein [Mucilaginibacter glaciei]|uniref:DUF3179 domain-containing protein n=1 Tax=Mucilaginibacter glaciei TaxID=2772109 RepID=A0A926NQ96_9SPHI|nr:DUF3179 domain-containing (seleno)protein [Mucilaginibacter glaciei]MBD1392692.1 DUF3179 domain-containing protein [Mucilaginibacter glaciei]